MKISKQLKLINKIIKKKKEKVLLELIIENYNDSNFYISLIYNYNIEKFKVLYVPLDVIENSMIEEYFCYQFIAVKSVAYIIEQIKQALPKYQLVEDRDKTNKNINNFLVGINIYLDNCKYDFKTTRYIPKDWSFMFEAIVMLFEHAPNIMSELVMELLSVIMNNDESVDYQLSISGNLNNKEVLTYFPESKNNLKVTFLEQVNNKYYAIIDSHLVIIENNRGKLINIYCDKKNLVKSEYVYEVIKAIQQKEEKKFYKIKLLDSKENETYNFLCLGVENKELIIIKNNELTKLSLEETLINKITILEDHNNMLKQKMLKAQQS